MENTMELKALVFAALLSLAVGNPFKLGGASLQSLLSGVSPETPDRASTTTEAPVITTDYPYRYGKPEVETQRPIVFFITPGWSSYPEKEMPLKNDLYSSRNIQKFLRVRRSPGSTARLDVNAPMWTSNNGRHQVQGNAFYERNWNTGGPRRDYGGNVQYTYRFPG